MHIPDFSQTTWDLIYKYNDRFPKHPLGTLGINPDLEEKDLVEYLNEAISENTPIKDNDYRVYFDPSELPEGALW